VLKRTTLFCFGVASAADANPKNVVARRSDPGSKSLHQTG
jgi:hypothetical protein